MPLGGKGSASRKYTAFQRQARREAWAYLRTCRSLFRNERNVIAAALTLSEVELQAFLMELPASYMAGGDFWGLWASGMSRRVGGTWGRQAEGFADALGISFDLWNPRTVAALRSHANQLATYIGTDTAQGVTTVLAEGSAQGWSMRQRTQGILDDVYDPSLTEVRAKRIARTESVGALNEGEYEGAKGTGVLEEKSWLTQGDDKVRPNHAGLNGMRIPLELTFPNGLRFPGDMNGPVSERVNCRCTCLYYTLGG